VSIAPDDEVSLCAVSINSQIDTAALKAVRIVKKLNAWIHARQALHDPLGSIGTSAIDHDDDRFAECYGLGDQAANNGFDIFGFVERGNYN
jgi:hypothetical protein